MPSHEPAPGQDRGRYTDSPPYPREAPPAHPEEAPPAYPNAGIPVPGYTGAPLYPGDVPPAYPGDLPPAYPGEPLPQVGIVRVPDQPPPFPGPVTVLPTHEPPEYPLAQPVAGPALPPGFLGPPTASPAALAVPPPQTVPLAVPLPPLAPLAPGEPAATPTAQVPPRPSFHPENLQQDDLALQSGRKHLKARQRGVDGAALSQLVVTLPTAMVSFFVVAGVFSAANVVVGLVMTMLWLLSGLLVFHPPTEAAIAQHLLGMQRPGADDAQRLAAVWEEVTRRAGVRSGTYELWIQESADLNATAAAGHIVGVTRHAMDRLPNTHLAAILAHELGHHVGGHPWAGLLADWYALPARTVWRLVALGLSGLLRSKSKPGIACGGCLSLLLVQFVFVLAFKEGMWWLIVAVIAAPVLVAWLRRRAEQRADDYAAGLGFGPELMAVLAHEHQRQVTPMRSPTPLPYPPPAVLPPAGSPYGHPAPTASPMVPGRPGGAPAVARSAHTNFEARLQRLRRSASAAGR